ncbi:MAG: cytochrome c1 [Paracoccaceae bacterium]
MIKNTLLSAFSALLLTLGGAFAQDHGGGKVENIKFAFDGPFGKWDQMQLQRGLQVYTEVCSACHGLKYVPLRTVGDLGYTDAEVRAYAAQWEVFDADLDDFRAALPTDNFPASGLPEAPDLSLMAKARAGFHGPYALGINQLFKGIGGPEYIVAVLTGYTGEEIEEAGSTFYENPIFGGGKIAMAQPLFGEDVEYADGHSNDLHHEAEDVAAFLMWTAEPKMMVRKRVGFLAVTFLTLLSVLLYLTNKRLWKPIKNKTET